MDLLPAKHSNMRLPRKCYLYRTDTQLGCLEDVQALTIFQLHRDLEAGDTKSLKFDDETRIQTTDPLLHKSSA